MGTVKLDRTGRVRIPKKILKELGLTGDTTLIVETTEDGAIVLRPAGTSPVEIYRQARIREFLEANELTPEEEAQLQAKLEQLRAKQRRS